MSEHEVQFLLAAFRPDGSDADDPGIAAALRNVRTDPERSAAFDDQLRFDAAVAAALEKIGPPVDLRERILSGARLSRNAFPLAPIPSGDPVDPRRRAVPWLTAVAALLAVIATVTAIVLRTPNATSTVGTPAPDWTAKAVHLIDRVTGGEFEFDLRAPDNESARAWLAREVGNGREVALPAQLADLAAVGCKCIETEGGRIALVCLDAGGGTTLHLTVFPLPDDDPAFPESPAKARFETGPKWSLASWRSATHGFVLAAAADPPEATDRMRTLLAPSTSGNARTGDDCGRRTCEPRSPPPNAIPLPIPILPDRSPDPVQTA